MVLITNSKALNLRSHLDKYLIANADNRTVCVSRNCITRRSIWIAEPSHDPATGTTIRLKSYATGLFLAASDLPSPLHITGKRVVQSAPLDDNNDKGLIFDWEPIRDGFQIMLKARGARGNFLRANSGLPPWNNSVTHDAPAAGATKFWTLWEVVPVVEVQEKAPDWAGIDTLSPSTLVSSLTPSEQSDDDDLASGLYPSSLILRLSMNKHETPHVRWIRKCGVSASSRRARYEGVQITDVPMDTHKGYCGASEDATASSEGYTILLATKVDENSGVSVPMTTESSPDRDLHPVRRPQPEMQPSVAGLGDCGDGLESMSWMHEPTEASSSRGLHKDPP